MNTLDQTLVCSDCGTEFPFTASEQSFYAQKGFAAPRRCKPCRDAAKASRGSGGGSSYGGGRPQSAGGQRQMHDAVCAACGVTTQVPFKPSGEKPVYCRSCFQSQR